MAKTAVITGAGAMDAKSLARFLQHKNYNIVLTHRRNSLFDKAKWYDEVQIEDCNLHKISFEVCDIVDQNSIRECLKNVIQKFGKVDELYMIAAMSHVGYSFSQKEYSIMANGQSYYYFLEALKDISKNTKVYGCLSSELAGNVPEGFVFNEETIWNPKSPYSIGKALGGYWIKFYRESKDSNIFTCFGILFNHSNWFRTNDFFISKVCAAASSIALGKLDKLKLGNLNFYRDEHWSDFGVEMMWKMLQNEKPKDYVIANGITHHGEEFLEKSFGYYGLKWQTYVVFDKDLIRPNEVERLVGDSSKAQKELGWKPNRISFDQHIQYLCDYHAAKLTNTKYILPNLY